MMTTHTKQLVQRLFTCLIERDLTELITLFAADVDWYVPGNKTLAPWIGRRNDSTGVKKFFQLLWENTESISATVEHMFTDENVAIITGEFSSRMLATNKIVESIFSIQITFNNGLITRYRLLEDSYAVSEAMKD